MLNSVQFQNYLGCKRWFIVIILNLKNCPSSTVVAMVLSEYWKRLEKFNLLHCYMILNKHWSVQGLYIVSKNYFQGLYIVSKNFQGVYKVPKNYFQGVYKVPKNFQGVYIVPKNFQGVYKVPKNFQGLYIVPKNFQGLYIVPKNFQVISK